MTARSLVDRIAAKGAAVRDDVLRPRASAAIRVKLRRTAAGSGYPGKPRLTRSDDRLLAIRQKSGPDSVYCLVHQVAQRSCLHSTGSLAAFWGTNNSDHQARICHVHTGHRVRQLPGARAR